MNKSESDWKYFPLYILRKKIELNYCLFLNDIFVIRILSDFILMHIAIFDRNNSNVQEDERMEMKRKDKKKLVDKNK